MLKKLATIGILSIAVLPLTSHAQVIAGMNFNKSFNGDLDLKYNNNTTTYDLDTHEASFFIGHKNYRNNRFLLSLNKQKFKVSDLGYSSYSSDANGLRLDWQFVYGEQILQPYWGAGFGLYSLKSSPIVSGKKQKQTGFALQAMGGTKVSLRPNLELDFSLQMQGIKWQNVKTRNTTSSSDTSMDNIQIGASVGFAYIF